MKRVAPLAARSPALAKLTRPKLYDALSRPRLFALLDEASTHPIIWVSAPPGAGKTTLVASWLETRHRRHLWYQVDAGDADPATFVHYIRTAAMQLAGKSAAALPLFTSEPQQDLAGFARGFFRDLFSVLPPASAVVLDNFHEAKTPSAQRAAMAQGLEEIPEGMSVIVLSRADPPPEFARLLANRKIARIDEAALRCTPEEASAILGGEHDGREDLQRIQRQSEGWMAALVLLREHLRRHGAALDDSLGEGKDAIFQYFAGEIFNGARALNQRILMLTAIPPSITQDEAVALTGSDEAPRLLEYLYRRHLFTDRRKGAATSYHYHALFREFLLEELRERIPADERRDAGARAAALLAERGQVSEALALFREAGEWEAMRTLIRANALDWARQGRAQALSDWIETLPSSMRDGDPWLQYWFGRAWIFVQPQRGRPALERAFDDFRSEGDVRGQALSLSTIVTGYYYEWANFAPLDRCLPEFERLLAELRATPPDRESELRACAAYLIALLFRDPENPSLAQCARRLDELIDDEGDVNVRMMAASTLFNYLNWKTDGDTAAALVARMEPVVIRPDVTPLMGVWWRTHLSFWHFINGRYDKSATVIAEARAIAERYGLEAYLFEIDHAEATALVSKGDLASAKALIEAMEHRLSPARRMDWAYFHFLRSMFEQRHSRFASAAREAEQAIALARETGLPALQIPHFFARLAHSRFGAGDRKGGMHALDQAIALASVSERKTFEQMRELMEIEADIETQETDRASVRLATVLQEYRERGQHVFLRNRPEVAARLAQFALEQGIEVEFVRTLIEKNALAPPDVASPAWPFRLRVQALGRFELIRDGESMRFSGKTQQRPLDLLKVVVALGGREVDSTQVIAALWPDADGAAAKTSFDTTLFRLRKLIDVDDAVLLAAGKLSLSPARVWTDVWALERTLDAADRIVDESARDADAAPAARRLVDAYTGPLLGTDEDPWIAKSREALRARVVRTLMRLGEALERQHEWSAAIDVYRRGIEADNLAESLYRGLMRSLAAAGDRAEALNAFRRCRDLLSIVLGVSPAAETIRLHREISAAHAGPVAPL